MSDRLRALAAAALLLAACQPVPLVMERDKASRLLAVPDSLSVEIGRIAGVGPELEAELRGRLETALQHRGLLATARGGNLLSYLLVGRLASQAGGRPRLEWELRAWDGSPVARLAFPASEPEPRFDALAEAVANAVRSDGRGEGAPRLKVSLAPIVAPDPEAAAPLARAVEAALARRGFEAPPASAPSHLHVFGEVALGPIHAGLRRLRLVWRVRWSDGREIGDVEQSDLVLVEELERGWGPLAPEIADGAAAGIAELALGAWRARGRP